LSFSPDGTRLASADDGNIVRTWNLKENADVTSTLLADNGSNITQIAASPDRKWIAGGGNDGTIALWDAQTGAFGHVTMASNNAAIKDLAWNHANVVAAIDENNVVNVVALDAKQATVNIQTKLTPNQHVAWADADDRIAVPANWDGVELFDAKSPALPPVSLADDKKQAWGVAPIWGSGSLLVSYTGGEIRIWNLASQQSTVTLSSPRPTPGSTDSVGSLSVSPDQHLLATSSGDGVVPIYDLAKRSVLQILETQSQKIAAVAFSPDGRRLAALGNDSWLYVWTIGDGGAALEFAITARRSLVGNAGDSQVQATWVDWIANDRIAVATNTAAINVITIDPDKWLHRIDGLAVSTTAAAQ
jgi:WD40 repeat protein